MGCHRFFPVTLLLLLALGPAARGQDLAARLRALDPLVVPKQSDQARDMTQAAARQARDRLREASRRESAAWHAVTTQAEWERYRDERVRKLRDSLGFFPEPPKDLKVRVTRALAGDGYRVENLVYESRPGLVVTANLYLPAQPPASMPGILICHSHHNPKTQGELQDMGMTWARLGCAVLVPDQLGHGERRQHPFTDAGQYPGTFRVGRQDYYFRYNVGLQLHLLGESLIGWMAWDMMRGVDLLLSRPGVDGGRVILLGSVAGGGDPVAVTAALDPRVACAVPFNFGGPQPETTYPLPEDAETSFNYAGGGSWESTRNLRLSARDGFLPWVIVGAVAPRKLIYGHEFSWDQGRDPVWKRLEKIYGFYGARDALGFTTGRGRLSGQPPESTHCNNIGPEHRKGIYPLLKRWFNIPLPEKEYQQRRPAEDLLCLTPEVQAQPLHRLLAGGLARGAETPRDTWNALLGRSPRPAAPEAVRRQAEPLGDVTWERLLLRSREDDVTLPALLLIPTKRAGVPPPVVVAVAQEGKRGFLQHRAGGVAALLDGGAAVCLLDPRGTGETQANPSAGRQSARTSLAASHLMTEASLLPRQLLDLALLLEYLGTRPDLDARRLALWGDSFTPANPPERNLSVPLDAERFPDIAEPLGGLLALAGMARYPAIRAGYAHGGLVSYASVLESPFVYVPQDVVVPGALRAGDLGELAATLAPRPVRLEGLVNGRNQVVEAHLAEAAYAPARRAYGAGPAAGNLVLKRERSADGEVARWLLDRLKE